MTLNLYDFRDLDLMLKVQAEGNEEGWVSTADLARSLGMEEDTRSVSIRSAWMKRYGIFDFDSSTRMWRLSGGGERVVKAKLKAAQASSIEKVPDEAMVDVMAHVTTRYRMGDPIMATMLRREFLYGTSTRSAIWNGR